MLIYYVFQDIKCLVLKISSKNFSVFLYHIHIWFVKYIECRYKNCIYFSFHFIFYNFFSIKKRTKQHKCIYKNRIFLFKVCKLTHIRTPPIHLQKLLNAKMHSIYMPYSIFVYLYVCVYVSRASLRLFIHTLSHFLIHS